MGLDVSAGPKWQVTPSSLNADPVPAMPLVDMREIAPSDLLTVETTVADEPFRRLICPNEDWLTTETRQAPMLPAEPVIIPRWNGWAGGVHGPKCPYRKRFSLL